MLIYLERRYFKMKRILFVMLIAFLVFGLIACGQSMGEQAVENMLEQMIEEESGGDVDVDISDDGDTVSFESDEGEVTIEGDEGGMPWPSDKLPAGFPVLQGATIVAVIDAGTGIMIGFEDCSQGAADAFMSNFTTGGWKVTLEMESEGQKIIMASKGENEFVQFGFSPEDGDGSITYGTN
jgi:hypothetical protein